MSFPAYPDYRDSGIEWLGEVPGHWNVTPLKRRVRIVGGSTPKSDVEAFWDGEIPWITPADLSRLQDFFIRNAMRCITVEGLASCGTTMVPANSIVLSTRAPIGSLGIAAVDLCTNQGCKALVPIDVDSKFLAYMLSICSAQLNVRGRGSTFLELSGDELGAFPLPCPSQAEQAAIGAFLDRETAKIDALVAEQERLIALLKEKRQAVISHAVTKGLNPGALMKDSGIEWLGEIPAHWEAVPLKYLVTLRSGGTPSKDNLSFWGGSVPWASAKDLKSDILDDTIDHLTDEALEAGASTLLPAGTVLVLVRGMMLARTFPVCETTVPMTINQDLKGVLAKEMVHAPFLAWVLRGTASETLNRLDEAGHGTKALRMEAWTSMELPLPPAHEQQTIAEFLRRSTATLDLLVAEAQSAITLLQERRAALISAAVTGKIDVRGLVEPVREEEFA